MQDDKDFNYSNININDELSDYGTEMVQSFVQSDHS